MKYILHAHYTCLARDALVVLLIYDIRIGFSLLVAGSFEPLAPEPEVAQQLAKGTKEKSQPQGDQEYSEREDDQRRDAPPFISSNRGPCGTT